MKTLLLTFFSVFLLLGNLNAQERMVPDNEKSKLVWLGERVANHHTGTIDLQSGWLTWHDNKITSGEFIINMASITDEGNSERLVSHLKSDDFFGVEKFPTAKLVIVGSSSFEKGAGVVSGTLTIKEVTNPIEFKADLKPGDEGLWFVSDIIIDRSKYNVRFGSGSFFDNLGDKAINDEFKLTVNLLVKKS